MTIRIRHEPGRRARDARGTPPKSGPHTEKVADRSATAEGILEVRRQEALLKTGALQSAIFNSANFSSIATDAKGVIQIFNVGAERMLGYAAADVMNKITPADISDPQEVIARAKALSVELGTPITPGLRGAGVQGLARHRGHLRADLHPQGRQPLPGGRVGHGAARRAGRHHRLSADRHRQHRAQAGGRGAAQGGGPAERDLQQRQFLEHRHRREGRHPDLQRRRRAHARLRGRRRDEQDHAGRHLRSAGSDRARQGAERRARARRSRRASRRWCSRPRAASRTSTS